MSEGNGTPVGFGRFDEYRHATNRRLDSLEDSVRGLEGSEQVHRALSDRIGALKDDVQELNEVLGHRRDRAWVLGITIMSSFVLPVLVTALITYLHIVRKH